MPTTYTHYRFGKDVLSCLSLPLRNSINEYRELFDIGLHGPDIFFYYRAMHDNKVNQIGFRMHEEPASKFFLHGKEILKDAPMKTAGRVYLYGFICHFALDSVCHPYIEKMIHERSVLHSEIETELDRIFMQKDGLDPVTYPTYKLIVPSIRNGMAISQFFEDATPAHVCKALKGMSKDLKLLHPKSDRMRNFLYTLIKLSRQTEIRGMVMTKDSNPDCQDYCELLQKLYAEAVPVAVSLINQYQSALFKDTPLSDRFDLNFSSGDHWEQLQL
ncbi:hypothetical protein DXB23_08180 [Dorea sp. OM02-2LB]|nr:hypothetical protein DXB23_08180 [Dorea sp. OM02-2LB]